METRSPKYALKAQKRIARLALKGFKGGPFSVILPTKTSKTKHHRIHSPQTKTILKSAGFFG